MTDSILGSLDTGSATAIDSDDLGGSLFGVLPSDIYAFLISEAYIKVSAAGAVGIHLVLKEGAEGEGRVLENTLYIQGKNKKSFYINGKGKEVVLPSYTLMDSLCEIVTGESIRSMTTKKMIVETYNFDTKAREPVQVDMLDKLIGKHVYAAVQMQIVNKSVKNDQGVYVEIDETRESNEIMKFFRAKDKKTITEIKADTADDAAFYHTWLAQWQGKTNDRSKKSNPAPTAGPAGTPASGVVSIFT